MTAHDLALRDIDAILRRLGEPTIEECRWWRGLSIAKRLQLLVAAGISGRSLSEKRWGEIQRDDRERIAEAARQRKTRRKDSASTN